VELIAEVWRRAIAVQPPPGPLVVALTAGIAAALVLPRAIWPYTRILVTLVEQRRCGLSKPAFG
jgi:hypothetical protein